MQKIILVFLCFLGIPGLLAQPNSLKLGHEAMMQYCGDIRLASGEHSFIQEISMSNTGTQQISWLSTMVAGNQFSCYQEFRDQNVYISGMLLRKDTGWELPLIYKIKQGKEIHTLQFKIIWQVGMQSKLDVQIDPDATDVRINYQKFMECVTKYAPNIIESIGKCMGATNWVECVRILLIPLPKVYLCVFGQLSAVPETLPRELDRKAFEAVLGPNTWAVYHEVGDLKVVNCYVNPSTVKLYNVSEAQWECQMVTDNVVKVNLTKVIAGPGDWHVSLWTYVIYQK